MTFDIFDFFKQEGWGHILLMRYLQEHNIQCVRVDVWGDDLIIILGCTSFPSQIRQVLGVGRECIYADDSGLILINLFQEKYLRGII